MIYTLTLNPALDYDMYLKDDLQPEHLNLAHEVNYRAGGKGINVSKVLKNLDVESTAIGFVAGFVGNFIIRDLQKDNIKSEFVEIGMVTTKKLNLQEFHQKLHLKNCRN